MKRPIHHMSVIRYYRDRPGWDQEDIPSPSFDHVAEAIKRMDNYCFPIVQLNPGPYEDDEGILHFVGGGEQIAPFALAWRFEDPNGSDSEVALGESDQGYFTKQKNVLTDTSDVLCLARVFAETSSYEELQAETERILLRRRTK
jgi:hypothetical protein